MTNRSIKRNSRQVSRVARAVEYGKNILLNANEFCCFLKGQFPLIVGVIKLQHQLIGIDIYLIHEEFQQFAARVCIIDIANEAIQEFYDSRQLQAMFLSVLFCQQFIVQHTFLSL